MKKLTITLIICLIALPIFAQNGTFHLICNIDRYSNIAESCKKDFDNIKAYFTEVSKDLNIPIKVYDVEFYSSASKKFISDFKCGPNDIVFYYYSGHGFRYDDQDVVWPFLNVCKSNNDPIEKCALSLNWIYQEIQKKGPRLTITMGDCCNSLIGMNEPKMSLSRSLSYRSQHEPAGYKKLFLETKGTVVVSGSIPGQYSLGTEDGGIYSNSLIEVLKNSRENSAVSWQAVLAKTTSISLTNSDNKQKPHFMVSDGQGVFYSEGNYPGENIVVDNNNNNNNNQVVEDNTYEDNTNNDNNVINENDYVEYNEDYSESELQSEALYAMGFIYILGLSADDNNISETEQESFYNFFNSTMTDWGYESSNVDEFINELSKWLENMQESDVEAELTNSLGNLKKSYDEENYNTIVFENLKQMVDNPNSEDFEGMLALFRSL